MELARLEQMKRDKLVDLIAEQRDKLHTLWDECHTAQSDRLRFAPLSSMELSDDVLEAHEAHVALVTQQVNTLRPILALIARRVQILTDKAEFEEMLKNPNRFKIAGWSIREEKIRKVINKELPQLNSKLLDELVAYEDKYTAFYYEGIHFRNVLQDELDTLQQSEEGEKMRKVHTWVLLQCVRMCACECAHHD